MDYPARQFTRSVLWHLATLGLLTITLLVCCSCSSTKQVTQVVEHVSKDTVYLSTLQYDSIYIFESHSSDVVHDTTYIKEKSIEYRYKLIKDTVRETKLDSIPYEVTIIETKEITRPLTWFDHLTRFSFWFFIGALATYIAIKLRMFFKR